MSKKRKQGELMRKNVFVMMFILLFLTGCTSRKQDKVLNNDIERYYEKDVLICDVNMGLSEAFSVKAENGNAYFLTDEFADGTDSENKEVTYLVKVPFLNGESESVLRVEGCHIFAYDVFEKDSKINYITLTGEEGDYSICEYDEKGTSTAVTDFRYENGDSHIEDILSIGENGFLLLFTDEIVLVDIDGNVSKCTCPGEQFFKAISLANGDVYASFQDKSNKYAVAKLDLKKGKIEKVIETSIPGMLLCEEKGNLVISNGSKILLFDSIRNSFETINDLSKNRISSDTVRAIESTENGFEVAVCIGLEEVKLNLVRLNETDRYEVDNGVKNGGRYDSEGKRIVYMYCPDGKEFLLDSIGGIIDCFNFENKEYSIEIIEAEDEIDPVFSSELHPDLCMDVMGTKIETYVNGGYLDDLYQYFSSSEEIAKDELPDFLTDAFEINGQLYALFRRFGLRTILIGNSTSELEEIEPDQFIRMVSEQKNIYTEGTLDRTQLMAMCFFQSIDEYVDVTNGKADFKKESFEKILTLLKEYAPKEAPFLTVSDLDVVSGNYYGITFIKQIVSGLKEIARTEAIIGAELSRVKIANGKGTYSESFYLPYDCVGIFANAECKEGAFAFIEYFMTSVNSNLLMGVTKEGAEKTGTFYTIESVREKAFNEAMGEIEVNLEGRSVTYEITQRHRDMVEEMIGDARYLNSTYSQIIGIMAEESYSFFQNDKDVSEVVDIIQNRVQLLFDEKDWTQ